MLAEQARCVWSFEYSFVHLPLFTVDSAVRRRPAVQPPVYMFSSCRGPAHAWLYHSGCIFVCNSCSDVCVRGVRCAGRCRDVGVTQRFSRRFHNSKKNAPLPRTIIVGSGAQTEAPLLRGAHRAQTPRGSSPGVTVFFLPIIDMFLVLVYLCSSSCSWSAFTAPAVTLIFMLLNGSEALV